MREAKALWPIVPPDPHLITIEEIAERCGAKYTNNLRNWIIRQGFSFVLARRGGSNQLTLCVTPEVWQAIAERRRAAGYLVRLNA
jgi:hypothetical protein